MVQAFTASPFTCTIQAPHWLVSQPTWGVDIGAATMIRRRLLQMRDEGAAILVISEELEELFEICDVLHVLHEGHLSPALIARETTAEEIGAYMIGAAP